MEIILQNAVFEDAKLKTYINRVTVNELNNLTEPCYFPDWQKHYHELLNLTRIKEKDIKSFIKRFYVGTKAQDALLQSDPGSNFLIILMYHFLKNNDQATYSTLMIYHMVRQYGNFIRRLFPNFCKPEVFSYTIDHLNPSHLFAREKTISNALFHLATEMKRRYTKFILELNAEKISDFLYESRGRIAQSLKSFAEAYYRNQEEGFGISTKKESETGEEIPGQELERGNRIAELVSSKICIYKEPDYKAFNEARTLTKVNVSLATIIIKKLQDTSLTNDIKFIVELFFRDMKSINEICGKDSTSYVKKLMSIKRTSKTVYFKQEINNLFLKIIKDTEFEEKYNSLTSQTQFQFNSFLAYYITFYIKNLVC
jgi:hypothetical protein